MATTDGEPSSTDREDLYATAVHLAEGGNVEVALGILKMVASMLEREDVPELPDVVWIPKSFREYLAKAFRTIAREPQPGEPAATGEGVVLRTAADVQKAIRERLKPADANRALNLVPQRGRAPKLYQAHEFTLYAGLVFGHRRDGLSYEESVREVASQFGISEKTVKEAWRRNKRQFRNAAAWHGIRIKG